MGYRLNRSTLDPCWILKDLCEQSIISKGSELHVMYIDLYKAFNSVPHWFIIKTLNRYDINSNLVNAIQQAYTNRKVYFKIDNILSLWIDTKRGTAQGDSLSALLFIICINSLLELLQNQNTGLLTG